MWIVALALRRPYTFIVMALVISLLTPLTILRTPTDIFPDINIPVVSVIWFYTGLSPNEMANRMITNCERGLTLTVNDIEHTESQSLNGIGIVKVFFRPQANIQTALSQVTSIVQTMLKQMPPDATPPLVVNYTASSTPVIQLGLSSKTIPEHEVFDLGQNFLRTYISTVQGAATPYPYGGKIRQVQVDLDLPRLQAKGLSPIDVVNAMNVQNLTLPTGTTKIGSLEYNVEMNGTPGTIAELNDLPVKTANGATIYIRDVAHVRDGFSPQTNIVRQDGNRGALMTISKIGKASTLDIVAGIKRVVAIATQDLPPELKITALFDQSLFVRASIQGVLHEALLAACLTALMILLFLGDWRPTLIICISIPLSIFVSVILLSALGETFNIMTLGGLALAVGILVDDATVEIENIERNIAQGKELKRAILDGAQQIAVPAFVSTLCICIVFVPMFFLDRGGQVPVRASGRGGGVRHAGVLPAFADTDSHAGDVHHARARAQGRGAEDFPGAFPTRLRARDSKISAAAMNRLLELTLEHRKLFASCFLAFCILSLGLVFVLGEDFFPSVDAGLIRLHLRGRAGLRVEETARLTDQVENVLRQEIPKAELQTMLDNIGVPYSGLNCLTAPPG